MSIRSVIEKVNKLGKLDINYPINYMIPVYHSVSDDNTPHIKNIIKYKSRKQFENDIDYMSRKFILSIGIFLKIIIINLLINL